MLVQTIFKKYAGIEQEAWSWFFPNILPTLLLLTGGFIATLQQNATQMVHRDLERLAIIGSFLYLLVLMATMLFQVVSGTDVMEWYKLSNFWLSPLQGFNTLILGIFYIRSEPPAKEEH